MPPAVDAEEHQEWSFKFFREVLAREAVPTWRSGAQKQQWVSLVTWSKRRGQGELCRSWQHLAKWQELPQRMCNQFHNCSGEPSVQFDARLCPISRENVGREPRDPEDEVERRSQQDEEAAEEDLKRFLDDIARRAEVARDRRDTRSWVEWSTQELCPASFQTR